MSKKISQVIITICFISICLSWILWLPLKSSTINENNENREKTKMPSLTRGNYAQFPKEFESYINDNIPFRNILIQLNSQIDYFIFNRSTSDKVAIGEDNWLFYTRIDDGDPIACYQGTNLLSEDELNAIAQNCIAQRDILASQGKEFIIFIAPNKERVYYDKMPSKYGEPANNYKALQIYNYLTQNTDLRVVYPYDEIMKAKSQLSENIWYKTDTHWNHIGGYVGATALMKELGIIMPDVFSNDISIIKQNNTSGDLAKMLNLTKQLEFADYEYILEGYNLHNCQEVDWDFDKAIIYKATNADPRSIYVIRDSFASQMAPYIGSQFNNSYLRHINTYTYDDLAAQDPDIVVYETVERKIDGLQNFQIHN